MSTGKKDAPSNVSEWLAEVGDGDLTPSQKAALADWLRESPAHVREFLQATLMRQDLGKLQISPQMIETWIEDAKTATRAPARIGPATVSNFSGPSSSARLVVPRRGRGTRVWLSAACLGMLVLAAALGLHWEEGRYSTAFGEQRIVTLADGSIIELNTDSALNVRFSTHRRTIHMVKGEAFFRVAHDAARPFVVSAGEASVKAVGTQFDVRINSESTLVSVVEGTVEVRDDTNAQDSAGVNTEVKVTAGEEARITPLRLQASRERPTVTKIAVASAQRSVSWTRGRIEFENTPLVDVLSEFQRYRHLRVLIEEDSVRQMKLTGSFDAHDPESALAYIATLPGITVNELDAHTFRIHRSQLSQAPRH
jgi:transmembrane sensor